MAKHRFSLDIEKVALETFSVVLGIGLAFAVNAWHENRTHAASACEALRTIRAELRTNDSTVATHLPYHEAMRDSLAALLARTSGREVPHGLQSIKNWSGMHPTVLLDDAWQTAKSTDEAQYLPYDLVVDLSRTYAIQQRLADSMRGLYAAVYTPAFVNGGIAAIAAMQSFLTDFASNEAHLAEQFARERKVVARYCTD